jgi:hypothetical protein
VATIAQLLQESIRNQHNMIDQAVQELTPEQLHWVARGTNANHIGFTLWHYVRTEDNVIQFILQDRKPTIWIEGNYFERFGLERVAQGTGMTTDDAHALRLPAIDQWMEYQRAVWKATDDFLGSVDDESLERMVQVKPLPEMKARQALSNVVLTHGHSHFGEICMLRVLQGLPSSNI